MLAAECGLLVLAIALGLIYENINRSRERSMFQPPGKLIDVGGYKLHLYCSGQGGPTVVLDFGLDGSYLDWYFVQPEVASFTRVCSYDRAGYGWSDASPRPRVPSAMAEELHTLLQQAQEKPPYIVVGHSFGSFNALMFAHKYRDEVAGVVLVDGMHPDQAVSFSLRQKLWLRMMQFTAPLGLPRWRKWCGGNVSELTAIRKALNCRSRVYRTNYAQLAVLPETATQVCALPSLGDLPLIVISRDPNRSAPGSRPSAEDQWQSRQARLAQLSSKSRQIIAEGSGHEIPTKRPDVIANAIRKMIAAISTQ